MRQVAAGHRVLYVATEDMQGLHYRVVAWRKARTDTAGKLTWLKMPEGLDLQDHSQVAELVEAIEPYQYDHIVIDTLREAHSGDENSSQDTRRINRATNGW
jgi:predicted ATP-dependent serine protease